MANIDPDREQRAVMAENDRKVLDFYARLASVENLGALRKGELLTLQEDWAALLPHLQGVHAHLAEMRRSDRASKPKVPTGLTHTGERFSFRDYEDALFKKMHERARSVLGDLVEGKVVQLAVTPFWQVTNGMLRVIWGEAKHPTGGTAALSLSMTTVDWLVLGPLLQVIESQRHGFPFRRCERCRRFFVQDKGRRRRFCSHDCMVRAVEATRRDRKREYMRDYMAKRRAKEKRRRRKGK